jgi:hypothetical protein
MQITQWAGGWNILYLLTAPYSLPRLNSWQRSRPGGAGVPFELLKLRLLVELRLRRRDP